MPYTHKFQLVKCFTLLRLSSKLASFMLATFISLHYNIYKNRVKLATFKIRYWYLNLQKSVLMNTCCVQGSRHITWRPFQSKPKSLPLWQRMCMDGPQALLSQVILHYLQRNATYLCGFSMAWHYVPVLITNH